MSIFLLGLSTIPFQITPAAAQYGSYSWWQFEDFSGQKEGKGFDSISYETTIEVYPGDSANLYWANQFTFTGDNPSGGYTGLQSNGSLDTNRFLFSLWDTTEARAGSEGSKCQPFGGEGEGMQCFYHHNWREGDRYQFTVTSESDGWFKTHVTNLDEPSTNFTIGSIRSANHSNQISPHSMVSWTEYFEYDSTCTNQPYARAFFKNPVTVPESRSFTGATDLTKNCPDGNKVTVTDEGAINETGIGYSPREGREKQPPARVTLEPKISLSDTTDLIPGEEITLTVEGFKSDSEVTLEVFQKDTRVAEIESVAIASAEKTQVNRNIPDNLETGTYQLQASGESASGKDTNLEVSFDVFTTQSSKDKDPNNKKNPWERLFKWNA